MTAMRKLYTLLFYAALPIILLRLYRRGSKAPAYRLRWQERLGRYSHPQVSPVTWLHAVSVGETEAAVPLIRLLQNRHPDRRILVTTTTPTGSARVRQLLGDSVDHVYLPYDLPLVIDRFFRHFRPGIAIFMEKEIWPNLLAACAARQVPALIVNARLSARSARAYLKIPGLVRPALACLSHIAAQTADDRSRFIAIGAAPAQISVQGNTKFDLRIEPETLSAGRAIKAQLFAKRFVWLAGSTHQGEESLLLAQYRRLKPDIPSLLMVLAPRHPERFQDVAELCRAAGLNVVPRSTGNPPGSDCDIYLADSMGELKMLYAAADLAFVGGSLVPVGGHNVLEPAAAGVPVLFGPHMCNFQEIAESMLATAAARQCPDAAQLADTVRQLYDQPACGLEMAANARRFLAGNDGATLRLADLLAGYWPASGETGRQDSE